MGPACPEMEVCKINLIGLHLPTLLAPCDSRSGMVCAEVAQCSEGCVSVTVLQAAAPSWTSPTHHCAERTWAQLGLLEPLLGLTLGHGAALLGQHKAGFCHPQQHSWLAQESTAQSLGAALPVPSPGLAVCEGVRGHGHPMTEAGRAPAVSGSHPQPPCSHPITRGGFGTGGTALTWPAHGSCCSPTSCDLSPEPPARAQPAQLPNGLSDFVLWEE